MARPRRDFAGERHGRLTVQETVGYDGRGNAIVRCLCDCGREVVRNRKNLRPTSQCARWDHDKLGERFGRLTVEDLDHVDAEGQAWFRCRCDCGNETVAKSAELANGDTKSCGCLHDENLAEHRAEAHVDGTNLDMLTSEPSVASTSGVRGVSRHRESGLWHAYINIGKRRYSLGYYRSLGAAAHVRREAEQVLFDPVLMAHGRGPTDEAAWRERIASAIRDIRARYDERPLTASEAARIVGVSPTAIVNAVMSGRIAGEKVGGRWSVDRSSLLEWMASRGQGVGG